MTDDTLIYYGGDVKALGSGKVGGYIVRFGTPETADCQGDYFSPECNFGHAVKAGEAIYYHHAVPRRGDRFSAIFGKRSLGDATFERRGDGLWVDGDLDISDPDVKALYADVEAGKLGWSSGSDDRLIVRGPSVKGKTPIVRWPINDASLSYVPVDPRNKAFALKALIEELEDIDPEAVAAPGLLERSERLVADATELTGLFAKAASQRTSEGRYLSRDKCEAIKALSDRLATLATPPKAMPTPEQLLALKRRILAGRL